MPVTSAGPWNSARAVDDMLRILTLWQSVGGSMLMWDRLLLLSLLLLLLLLYYTHRYIYIYRVSFFWGFVRISWHDLRIRLPEISSGNGCLVC